MTAAVPTRDTPFRWGEVLTAVPRAVWAVSALHLALILGWSLVTPIYQAPDEPQHFDLARGVAADWAYPEYDERLLSKQVTRSMQETGFSETGNPFERTRGPVTAPDAEPRSQRPAFSDLAADEPSGHINPAPQHPPLYYTLGAVWLTLVPDAARLDLVVWALRLLNALLLAPVPLLVFAATRRLTQRPLAGVLAAVLMLGVPQYLHIGGAVNNDPLLTVLFAVLTLLTVAVAGGDMTWRTAVWIGLVGTLALLTKGFALILPVWVGSAYLIGCVRSGRWRQGLSSGAVGGGLVVLLGGWWWVRNLIVHDTLQTTLQRFPDANPGFEPSVAAWWDRTGGWFIERFWGSFGWVDVTLSDEAVAAAAWTMLVLLVLGVALRPAGAAWWRADLVVALLPLVLIMAVVMYGSYSNYAQSGRITGMQGRYLFPGLPGAAMVAAAGLTALTRRCVQAVPLIALAFIAWLQWTALRLVLYFWYSDGLQESMRNSVAAVLAWAPAPRPVTVAIVGSAALAGGWLVGELGLLAARGLPAGSSEAGEGVASGAGGATDAGNDDDDPGGPGAGAGDTVIAPR